MLNISKRVKASKIKNARVEKNLGVLLVLDIRGMWILGLKVERV